MNLDELTKLASTMTPGPWFNDGYTVMSAYIPNGRKAYLTVEVCETKRSMPDADGIVALRNAAPALIAAARERDELAALLWEARQELDHHNRDDGVTTSLIAKIDAALARLKGTEK
jgi:hypothetical protein